MGKVFSYVSVLQVVGGQYSDEGALNSSPVPGCKSCPLNQGLSKTCTCHAIANTVVDQLQDKNINTNQSSLADTLVAYKESIGAVWPNFYNKYPINIQMMNKNNLEWISIKTISVRTEEKVRDTDKYVLTRCTNMKKQPDGTMKWCDYHCVFMQERSENYYVCVKSWEEKDQRHEVAFDRARNQLWRVRVEIGPALRG